jgi:hypothetical protein
MLEDLAWPRYTEADKKKYMGNSLEYIGTGDDFLNRTPIMQTLKLTINKWNLRTKTLGDGDTCL